MRSAPRAATCDGEIYDFFVVSKCVVQAVHSVVTLADGGFTPRSPARLYVRVAARHDEVKGIAAPKGVRAHLPFGLLTAPDEDEETRLDKVATHMPVGDINLDAGFGTLMAAIEVKLLQVSRHDKDEALAHSVGMKVSGLSNGLLSRSWLPTWVRSAWWLGPGIALRVG